MHITTQYTHSIVNSKYHANAQTQKHLALLNSICIALERKRRYDVICALTHDPIGTYTTILRRREKKNDSVKIKQSAILCIVVERRTIKNFSIFVDYANNLPSYHRFFSPVSRVFFNEMAAVGEPLTLARGKIQ